ncbi:hypothetical protein B0H13DRAFT_2305299 [Mycena leptocephala]|nr:hypothetical protein B0H13DRAFT_2305299 [Mycena leptocephala]
MFVRRVRRRCRSSRSKPSSEGPLGPPFLRSSTCSMTTSAMFVRRVPLSKLSEEVSTLARLAAEGATMCDVNVDPDKWLADNARGEPAVWPVILWVAFQVKARYSLPKLRSTDIDALLAIIESQADEPLGLWHWDDTDEKMLWETFLSQDSAISLWIDRYPRAWREYIRLLDSRDWARMKALTRQTSRPRLTPTEYDAGIRAGAIVLWTSSNSISKSQQTDTILTLDGFVADMVEGWVEVDKEEILMGSCINSDTHRSEPRYGSSHSADIDGDVLRRIMPKNK